MQWGKRLIAASVVVFSALATTPSAAEPLTKKPVVPAGGWAGELKGIADLIHGDGDVACNGACFVVDRLHLSGPVAKGSLDFEVEGSVLGNGAFDIPLFGPPQRVRIEDARLDGDRATIGFEGDHYYVHTDHKHFVLRGKVVLPDDRSLVVTGPVNSVVTDVTGGRVTEGNRLSGVAAMTLHFDAEGAAPTAQPTLFSIARAIRIGKNIEFEYRLTVQSGTDIGVLKLPLRYGEKPVDVGGSNGWRIEGEELILPTTGKAATVTVSGTLSNVSSFSPDPRAPFEWWLFETDPEHRVVVTGDAKQHDSSESPITRKQPNSRLFLVQRGQHVDVTTQTLQSVDVLAAVVHGHSRTVVLTAGGDVVAQDMLSYENNGIDYLHYTPDGKPTFLSIDGASERILRKDATDELMIPLRTGRHNIVMQSVSTTSWGFLGGRIVLPTPKYPLAASSQSIVVGVPDNVHPVIATGGEHTDWPLNGRDAAAAVAAALACLLLRGWRRRSLGFASAIGLWFFSKPLFLAALGLLALVGVGFVLRKLDSKKRRYAIAGLVLSALVAAPVLLSFSGNVYRSGDMVPAFHSMTGEDVNLPQREITATPTARDDAQGFMAGQATGMDRKTEVDGRLGNYLAQNARGGIIDGVTPVALTLPSYARSVTVSREVVTADRPFSPTVFYVTDNALALLTLIWLAAMIALGWSHRAELAALRDRLRAALQPTPATPAITPDPEPTPAE